MKDTNMTIPMDTKVHSRMKIKKKYNPYIYSVLIILWISISIIAIMAWTSPLIIEEKLIENAVEIKTAFDYKGVMKPSTLYPRGGEVSGDEVIFTELADKFIIHLETDLFAEKPVKVEGTAEVSYTLVGEDMWHKDYEAAATRSIQSQGLTNSLLKEDITINLQQLFDLISKIEEETDVHLGDYLLILKPNIKGSVYQENGDKIYDIDTNLEIPFNISNQYIKYAAESPEKEFIETQIIESVNSRPKTIKLFSLHMPIQTARYLFGSLALLLSAYLLISGLNKIKSNQENISEIDKINRKYKNKIINISNKLVATNQVQVSLSSFQSLMQIAEDKDEPILKYENYNEKMATYYVVSTTNVYFYEINESKKVVKKANDL